MSVSSLNKIALKVEPFAEWNSDPTGDQRQPQQPPAAEKKLEKTINKRLQRTQAQVNEVVDIMRVNIEKVLERDKNLSQLDDRADALQAGASQFEASAGKLKRKFWWRNCKISLIYSFNDPFIFTLSVSLTSEKRAGNSVNASNALTANTSFSLSPDLPQLEAQAHPPPASIGSRFNWIFPHGKEENPSTLQQPSSAQSGDSSENIASLSKAQPEAEAVEEESESENAAHYVRSSFQLILAASITHAMPRFSHLKCGLPLAAAVTAQSVLQNKSTYQPCQSSNSH
ncbi:Synaptobrevin-like protein [Echinococcus granulosus]|uniref:Synaptobrevin-like protein n=1 Tax=Echinococcus granulosus TaxID=6210 RepID=W6UZN2_ECHGR|nr:Synaptobrevin-like protein [Echinococcus granulosus]EUB63977.1 Synaptobrevin-like protein [Echinococcus granulosus]